MSTTTIRLEDDLKTRINAAAAQAGKTAHAFILEELDNSFRDLADERWARIRATGQTVDWEDAKAYLSARAEGGRPSKPAARTPNKA